MALGAAEIGLFCLEGLKYGIESWLLIHVSRDSR